MASLSSWGEWILRRACAQFDRWRSEGLRLEYMSVNVSMRQLRDENYMATLNAALADSGMQGNDLQIDNHRERARLRRRVAEKPSPTSPPSVCAWPWMTSALDILAELSSQLPRSNRKDRSLLRAWPAA